MTTPRNPFAPAHRRPTLAGAMLPPRVRDALEDVLSLVYDEVVTRLDFALNDLETQLSLAAEHASTPGDSARQVAALRRVQRHRDSLAPRLVELLQEEFARLRDPARSAPPPPTPAAPVSFRDLRLVEDDEADEDVVIRSLAMRHEARASLPLQLLGQRFGVLGARPAFDADTLPIGPRRLTTLLGDAAEVLEVAPEVRMQLLRLFDRQVLAGYETLVEMANAALVHRNVLPSLAYVPLRRQARALEAAPAATPAIAASPAPAVALDEAFDFVLQLLERRRGLLGRLRATAATAPAAALTDAMLRAALRPLQGEPVANPARVRQALLERGVAGLSREQADIFELVGLLFAHLGRELRPDSAAVDLLQRLLVAVLRVALADHGLFEQPRHPVRLLLDDVASTGTRWLEDDDLDPHLHAAAQRAVAQVLAQYDDDVRVFAAAHDAMQDPLQAQARRAEVAERRQVDAARGKERLALGKRRAADAIDAAIGGATLPRFTRALLTQSWADVLTLTALRHGPDSEDWRRQVEATEEVVAALTGQAEAPAGLDRLLAEALGTVGYDEAEALLIARHLAVVPGTDEEDAASRTELMMRLKARTRLGEQVEPLATPAALSPAEQAFHQQLLDLPPGAWIEFGAASGPVVRRKLAWLGPATGTALLVNHRGQRIDEQPLDSLARQLAAGQARIVTPPHGSLVDRAWQATIASLRGFGGDDEADA